VIFAVPDAPTKLQDPLSGEATELPAMVKLGVEHLVWSGPAADVGCWSLRITTSSVASVHTPFLTVQRRVMLRFSGTDVMVVALEVGVVMIAVPLAPTKLQDPLSGEATEL